MSAALPAEGPASRRVLAVDGGNAKTDLGLLDADGRLLSLVRGEGSSTHYLGIDGAIEVITDLFQQAAAQAGLDAGELPLASSAYLLLAGADLPEERSAVEARFRELGWSARLVVDNDTLALLRAGTDRGWGIAVVCGAGINCLGRDIEGREVRFLSLGRISGDWGGGGDIGLEALFAASRGVDGRGRRTVLETSVPAHFGLNDPAEVACGLHLRQIPEARMVELAPLVLAAAEDDPVAEEIVRRLADEVIALASAALRRLGLLDGDPDVVLGGGLLRAAAPWVVDLIGAGVLGLAPRAQVRVSPSEPIVGAALLGLDELSGDDDARARARAELDAAAATLPGRTADAPPSARRSSSPPRPAPR